MADIVVRVKNKKQFFSVLEYDPVSIIIADYGCASLDIQEIRKSRPEKKYYLQLPDVLREKKADSVKHIAEKAKTFDGIVVKNTDELGLLSELSEEQKPDRDEDFPNIIGDSFLYAYNTSAVAFYKALYPQMKFILSDELTDREAEELLKEARRLKAAEPSDFIYKAYGYQPLMITNQCMNRNYAGCAKPLMEFADEKNHHFFISSECGQCYDIVYNGRPTVMLDKLKRAPEGFLVNGLLFENILLDFTIEEEGEIGRILDGLFERKDDSFETSKLTRGHHLKGVE